MVKKKNKKNIIALFQSLQHWLKPIELYCFKIAHNKSNEIIRKL